MGHQTSVEQWKLNKAIKPSAHTIARRRLRRACAGLACLAWLGLRMRPRSGSTHRRPDEVHRDRGHLRQADLAHHLEQAIRVGLQELRELRTIEVGDLAS